MEGLVTPFIPVDGIVRMLEQVGAATAGKAMVVLLRVAR